MEIKPEHYPLRIPLTGEGVKHGGTEHRLSFEDLAKEIVSQTEGVDPESVLLQVNISDTSIGFVFREVL
jgi:hypothetical protein